MFELPHLLGVCLCSDPDCLARLTDETSQSQRSGRRLTGDILTSAGRPKYMGTLVGDWRGSNKKDGQYGAFPLWGGVRGHVFPSRTGFGWYFLKITAKCVWLPTKRWVCWKPLQEGWLRETRKHIKSLGSTWNNWHQQFVSPSERERTSPEITALYDDVT